MGRSIPAPEHPDQLQHPAGGVLTDLGEGDEDVLLFEDEPTGPGTEFLDSLRRGWKTIVLVFVLVTGLVTVFVLLTPPRFEAESRLLVRIGREYVYRPEIGNSDNARAPSLSEIVNSEVEILSSRDLADQVVSSIGVGELYPETLEEAPNVEAATARAVPKFREATSIRPVLESSVIKVGFEHEDPELAARAVNLLVELFEDKHLEVFGEDRAGTLERQLAQREANLAQAEEALTEFKATHGVFDLDEQRRLLLERGRALEDELRASELALAELRLLPAPLNGEAEPIELPPHLTLGMSGVLVQQRYELERELRQLGPQLPDQLVQDASLRLLDLQLEEMELLGNYNESNRRVRTVRDEIERVQRFLAGAEEKAVTNQEEMRDLRTARAAELRSEISRLNDEVRLLVRAERQRILLDAAERRRALEVRSQDLRQRQKDLEAELRSIDGHDDELRQIQRDMVAATAAVEECRARLDDAQLSEELDREKRINVRVIERAAPPVVPSGLPRKLKLALGLFVGLLAGVGSAVLADAFRAR